MGSHSLSMEMPGDLTAEQVAKRFADLQEHDRREHGERYDNGSWSSMGRLRIVADSYPNATMATEALLKRTEKSECMAVKTVAKERLLIKRPTSEDSKALHPGEIWYWSYKLAKHIVVPELSEKQQNQLLTLLQAEAEARKVYQLKAAPLIMLSNVIPKLDQPEPDWAAMKKARKTAAAAYHKLQTLKQKLTNLEAKLRPLVWQYKDLPPRPVWVIAGWAAS